MRPIGLCIVEIRDRKLKRNVANLSLDLAMLQPVVAKGF